MTRFLIQDSNVPYIGNLDVSTDSLDRLGIKYSGFGLVPFKSDIIFHDKVNTSESVIVRGTTKILKMLFQEAPRCNISKWVKSGIFYDIKSFDQEFYSKLGLPLLNADAKFYDLEEICRMTFSQDKFVKPSQDLKYFSGGILRLGESLKHLLSNQTHDIDVNKGRVMVSSCKSVKDEYRFFVIGDAIFGSRSHLSGRVSPSSLVPNCAIDFVGEINRAYKPNFAYIVDICTVADEGGYSIVEYNCLNCSGFYNSNIDGIFSELYNYANWKE